MDIFQIARTDLKSIFETFEEIKIIIQTKEVAVKTATSFVGLNQDTDGVEIQADYTEIFINIITLQEQGIVLKKGEVVKWINPIDDQEIKFKIRSIMRDRTLGLNRILLDEIKNNV